MGNQGENFISIALRSLKLFVQELRRLLPFNFLMFEESFNKKHKFLYWAYFVSKLLRPKLPWSQGADIGKFTLIIRIHFFRFNCLLSIAWRKGLIERVHHSRVQIQRKSRRSFCQHELKQWCQNHALFRTIQCDTRQLRLEIFSQITGNPTALNVISGKKP